jgi:hypothetical protein
VHQSETGIAALLRILPRCAAVRAGLVVGGRIPAVVFDRRAIRQQPDPGQNPRSPPGWGAPPPRQRLASHPAAVWGFVGAFFASMLAIVEEFRKYSLTPEVYYSQVYRLLFSSTAAFLVGQAVKDSFSSMLAFGVGLFAIEKTWDFISEKTAQVLGAAKPEGEKGAGLADIQGLEDSRDRQKLVSLGITTVQALATADPLLLFFRTTLPIRTVVDMIDKAILYLYIGDKVKELRMHGINGVIGRLRDSAIFRCLLLG